ARVEPETQAQEEDGENAHVPLNLACKHASLPVVRMLLEAHAKIRPDAEGLYPQHIVAKTGRSAAILLALRDRGADLNQLDKVYCWSPLFHAAAEGHAACLRTLLENRVDIDVRDEKGLNAMYYAAWEGHLECMIMLWEQRRRRDSIAASAATPAVGREAVLQGQQQQQQQQLHQPPIVAATPFINNSRPPPPGLSSGVISPDDEEAHFDSLPDFKLPPPIIPMRRYGHNFLESKAFVQIMFEPLADPLLASDAAGGIPSPAPPQTSQTPPSQPATAAAAQDEPASSPAVASPAGSRVPATGPVRFYQPGRYAAARLTLSSKNSDLIPRTIMLPMLGSTDSAAEQERIVTLQVDLEQPSPFALEFEVFPTFGSKPIAKTVALPEVFVQHVVVGGQERLAGKSGSCVLPLLDPRLRAIGEVRFNYMVIQPYHGEPLEITHFAPYWKATTTGPDSSEPRARRPSTLRSLTPTHTNGQQLPGPPSAAGGPPAALPGLTAGLVTGSSLTGDYVQLFVQLTRDLVPVVYPHFSVDFFGLQVPISHLTLEQFRTVVPATLAQGRALQPRSHPYLPPADPAERLALVERLTEHDLPAAHRALAYSFLSLREVLQHLPLSINVDLCIIHPAQSMSAACTAPSDLRGPAGGQEQCPPVQSPADLNTHVDAILADVFDHARTSKDQAPDAMRSIIFTSFSPDICVALNWKQPNYPVFLCNDMGKFEDLTTESGHRPVVECCGRTSMSIKESARVAQSNNLMGVILRSSLLNLMPDIIKSIRELGLAIIADTSAEKPPPVPAPVTPMSAMGLLGAGARAPPLEPAPAFVDGNDGFAMKLPDVNGYLNGAGVLRFNDADM
ncbi:phosphate system positive regulatory protein pho81, partial [Ascosphaera acerosa]